jgi:predicted HicB family RNase H-like nuclease
MPETVVHFQIRMPPALHEQLASWAKEDKASLNALIVGILEKAIEQHGAKANSSSERSLTG